jgi:two-component system chemotaxis response regulator CheB
MTGRPVVSRVTRPATTSRSGKTDLLVIGSSTGGPAALQTLVPALPKDFPAAVVLVQHFPVGFSQALAESLGRRCRLTVSHAVHGEAVRPGHVLVAPAGMEFTFQGRPGSVTVNLSHGKAPVSLGSFRPSVDVVMTSAARTYGDRVMGVLLTGMGRDGAQGMLEIKKVRGRTIAQDESTCVVFGMPKEAIKLGAADKVSPLPEIPADILNML